MEPAKFYPIDWKKYLSAERQAREDVLDPIKDSRNPFEVDFGKVIFCPALRRMHDKTQVIPLSSGDCISTRLTHSLHVMNIAESLACNYTRSEEFNRIYSSSADAFEDAQQIRAILKAASLLHDIGNPPFGHFGEETIKDYFTRLFSSREDIEKDLTEDQKKDFTEFDGNALGLRIVSKLQYFGNLKGLNLTYGILCAYMKYPNPGPLEKEGEISKHKHGVFHTEQPLFNEIVAHCNMRKEDGKIKRHPLAFLVEASDTICYGIMDIEDGLHQGWYNIPTLLWELNTYINDQSDYKGDFRDIIGYKYTDVEIRQKDSRAAILELREHLITYLVDIVIRNFNNNLESIDKGTYNEELVYDDPNHIAEALKDFTKRKILSNKSVLKFEITGSSVITGLLNILIDYLFHKSHHEKLKGLLSESRVLVAMKESHPEKYHEQQVIAEKVSDRFELGGLPVYSKLRLIVDFVASMTDKYSVELYQTLSGNSL